MHVVSFRRYHQSYEAIMPCFPFSVKMKKQLPLGGQGFESQYYSGVPEMFISSMPFTSESSCVPESLLQVDVS